MYMTNPDIKNGVNPMNSHTSQIMTSSTSVGGRRRKTMRRSKRRTMRKHRHRTLGKRMKKYNKSKRSRRQRGGLNPTYRSYSASFDPGKNGMYANGPSVGNILEQFN